MRLACIMSECSRSVRKRPNPLSFTKDEGSFAANTFGTMFIVHNTKAKLQMLSNPHLKDNFVFKSDILLSRHSILKSPFSVNTVHHCVHKCEALHINSSSSEIDSKEGNTNFV